MFAYAVVVDGLAHGCGGTSTRGADFKMRYLEKSLKYLIRLSEVAFRKF
jgi:hypothetical protein